MAGTELTVTEHLRDKLRSKIDVAKFFTGFITLFVGILLHGEGASLCSLFAKFGIAALILSLGFCVAAMFVYDDLLWPRKYWKDTGMEVSEEYFHNRLRREMTSAWWWLFIPAVGCFGLGLVLVLWAELGDDSTSKLAWGLMFVVALGLPTMVCLFRWPDRCLQGHKDG